MRALLILLRLSAGLMVLGVAGLLGLWSGPDIEVAIAPVLDRQSTDGVDRLDGGRVACWTSRFDKVRSAEPVDAGWTIRAPGRIYPFERVRRVADSDQDGDALTQRRVRPGQWSRKCIDVPPELIGLPFRITGFAEYRTPLTGRFWTIRQPVAEVIVP